MSSHIVIRYCAPTLAGLKIGNLFSFKFTDEASLVTSIDDLNAQLNSKGVHLVILRITKKTALIYVYRKNKLETLLKDPKIHAFLTTYGYTHTDLAYSLQILTQHLESNDFPHEIGIFLGYPLSDIIAFIEHKGKGYKCVGCWKVYSNEAHAIKTFALFDKCTKIYCKKALAGSCINGLTVAS